MVAFRSSKDHMNFSELSTENVKIYNEFIKSVKEARRAYQDKLVKQK